MTESLKCDRCGQAFESSRFLRNQCPACLFAQALPDTMEYTSTPANRFDPPKVSELASLFPQLRIHELAGCGGMSAVYRASQTQLGRDVALKILPQEIAASHGGLERFQREARTLARLNHPNIVQVYDAGQAGPWCYIVMEFVAGPNLRQVLGDSHLPSTEVLRIAGAICDGLQYAHDQGVVHRDIKPENVLLDQDGQVKLVDFGLAKVFLSDLDHAATRTGQILGTPHYLAPEQIEMPTSVDHRADVYSLGVMMYEMLTGELPLGHFQPPSIRIGSDPALDEVVLQAMAKDRQMRYQQARDLRNRMSAATLKRPKARADAIIPVQTSTAASSWRQRLFELGLSGCCVLSAIVGILGILTASVIMVDLPKSNLPPVPNQAQAHPALPPSVALVAGLIALPLSFLFARMNASSTQRWKDFSWTQYPSLPVLLIGYAVLGTILLAGPGLASLLLGAFPLVVNAPSWTYLGVLFTETDRSGFLTVYWFRVYGISLLATCVWLIPFGLMLIKFPSLIQGVFHPTSPATGGAIIRTATLLAIAVGVPVGVALVFLSPSMQR